MASSITVDGVPLSAAGAYDVAVRTGWRTSPATRNVSVTAANVDGVLVPDRRAPLDPGAITLRMWVRGATYTDLSAHLDTLFALFAGQRGLLDVRLDTGGGVRAARARAVAAIPVEHRGPLNVTLTVALEIPAGVWTAPEPVYADVTWAAAHPVDVPCADPTAEITDWAIAILDTGTARRVTVTDGRDLSLPEGDRQRTHVTVDLPGPVSAGQALLIDMARWTARLHTGWPTPGPQGFFAAPGGVVSDLTSSIVVTGPLSSGAMLALRPGAGPIAPRIPQITVDASDPADGPQPGRAYLSVMPAWL